MAGSACAYPAVGQSSALRPFRNPVSGVCGHVSRPRTGPRSCLHRPDREEENLYKKLPQPKRRSSARGAWLMGCSVATAGPARVLAETRGVLGLSKHRGHYLDGLFFPHTRGNYMESNKSNPTNDNVGVLESAMDSRVIRNVRYKRKTTKNNSGSETEATPGAKCHTARRGRPPKARGAETARARKEQRNRAEKAREKGYDFERSLSDWARQNKSAQTTDAESDSAVEGRRDTSLCSAEDLRMYAGQSVASVLEVATKSGHLKGTYVRKLKEAAAVVNDIIEALISRTESEEMCRVREENLRLTGEVEKLRTKLQSQRNDMQGLRSTDKQKSPQAVPTPIHDIREEVLEELKRTIVTTVGTLIDARFATIEKRLLPVRPLRPPLAHVRRQRETATTANLVEGEAEVRRRPRQNKTTTAREDAPISGPEADLRVTADEDMEVEGGSWSTVAKRCRKGKKSSSNNHSAVKTTTSTTAKKQLSRPKVAKQPRTKAVMVTLTTDAIRKGVSYAQALEREQQSVNLVQLGITEGLTVRQTMSGARLLELSASHSAEHADMLAERLKIVLEGVAVVTRPQKIASMRLVGLDDSVTKEKVVEAVACTGGCPVEAVTVSDLLRTPRGMISAVVRCPCEAAKTIVEKGRILVGWSSAKVQVLEERPMRCFRCLSLGHTRPRCPSAVVREHLCFRCGCEGHKLQTCRATPRCLVCSDAKRPAGHIMGSADCHPPPIKGTEA